LYLLLNLPVILELVLAPGIASFSASLSWPHGTEFFDSYLKLETFVTLPFCLSHDDPDFCQFFEDVPFDILQQLADVDYHKSLIANRTWWEFRNWSGAAVLGTAKISPHIVFKCIRADKFDVLVSTCCQAVNRLEKAKVIRPYVPLLGSSRASALLRVLSRTKSVRRNSGLYRLGRGEKLVLWYWEFDVEKQYHH